MEDVNTSNGCCKFCPASASVHGPGRYTCPRCNARYCSADCYKSELHAKCSESFYRDCFMEGLHDMAADPTERGRMVDMLRRLENDSAAVPPDDDEDAEGEDEAEEDDLETRLAGVNLDGCPERIWERLTESERRQFDSFLSGGQLTDTLALWMPWWSGARSKLLIEDVSKPVIDRSMPSALPRIPNMSKLAGQSGISDLVPFGIINILYSYAYCARLYNGDQLSMASDSARVILDISEAIGRGVFSDVATAIGGCLNRLESEAARAHFVSREYSVAVVTDVCHIITGPAMSRPLEYVVAALSDCHRIFRAARKDVLSQPTADGVAAVENSKQLYYVGQKKLEFLLSWVVSRGSILGPLLPALELESCELTTQLAVYQSEHGRVKKALAHKKLRPLRDSKAPLITEIPSSE